MQDGATETLPRAETTCPSCGAPADPGQLVCLECGGRLALDYRRTPGWKLPVAVVLVVLVAAGAAFALGIHEITNDAGKEVAKAPPGKRVTSKRKTKPRATHPARRRPAARRPARRRPRRRPRPARRPTRPPARVPGVTAWPAGRNGYTVVLLSSDSRASATGYARSSHAPRVGVLRSTDYSSLQPHFWLVFSGVYRTRAQAQRAAGRLGGRGFSGAFPQFVNGAKRRAR